LLAKSVQLPTPIAESFGAMNHPHFGSAELNLSPYHLLRKLHQRKIGAALC
jgi:hypothetical protein